MGNGGEEAEEKQSLKIEEGKELFKKKRQRGKGRTSLVRDRAASEGSREMQENPKKPEAT